MPNRVLAILCLSCLAAAIVAGEDAKADWSVPVPGFVALKPNEHPRLLFRSADIPRLKERAATADGKAILARMDQVLAGPWTLWHGAAYGMKWLITGDQQWADKAREATELAIGGKADRDTRYNFLRPGSGGPMRSGPAMGAVGLAYDLAYGGWDDAFRQKVAKAISDNKWLADIAAHPPCGVGCNHFGSAVGGAGEAAVAIYGDTGIDQTRVADCLDKLLLHELAEMRGAWSSYAYFYEGHQCGRISASGSVPFLLAYRTAFGKDYASGPDSPFRWMGAKWMVDMVKAGNGYLNPQRGMYGRNFPRGEMVSQNGEFARAFAIAPKEFVPAMKWHYDTVIEPGAKTYDMIDYPHFGIYALAYWPLADVKAQNAGEVMPLCFRDPGPGYHVFRNGYTGTDDDIMVCTLLGSSPDSGRGMGKGGSIIVCGLGMQVTFPGAFWCSRSTHYQPSRDGSAILSAEMLQDGVKDGKFKAAQSAGLVKPGPTSLAVDYSGASGAPLLAVQVGPQAGLSVAYWTDLSALKATKPEEKGPNGASARMSVVEVAGQKFHVLTLQRGAAPVPKAEGGKLVVGGQTVTFDGAKLVLGRMAGEK